jgi:membrane fusion protein (multidrug efflux system)
MSAAKSRRIPAIHAGARMTGLDAQGRDPGEQSLVDLSGEGRVGDEEPSADAANDFRRVPGSRPQQNPPGVKWLPERDDRDAEEGEQREDQRSRSLLARYPLAFAIAFILFLAALPAGDLYWDYAGQFETTDDAYIAARQFAIAPEVSGYITAVPVTDNEHVAAGGVIARIDDRTYRAALA